MKYCIECNTEKSIEHFGVNGKLPVSKKQRYKPRCFKCDYVYELRVFNRKLLNILGAGNIKCQVCGYDKCISALEFHHLDPSQKDRTIASMRNYSETNLRKEINKCILLCSNHHREVHAGVLDLAGIV